MSHLARASGLQLNQMLDQFAQEKQVEQECLEADCNNPDGVIVMGYPATPRPSERIATTTQ